MIPNEKISAYMNSLLDLCPDETDKFYAQLVKNGNPVIKRDVAKFLSQIVTIKQPASILELGTNVGYSAIIMAKQLKNGKVYSVDHRKDLQDKARENFIEFGVSDKITLLNGLAKEILSTYLDDDRFDMIFIDADKKGYPDYLDYAVTHLNRNGIILVDNLYWKGSVISPEDFDKKKSVPILIEFNKRFTALEGFNSQILSIGDGLGFAVKED